MWTSLFSENLGQAEETNRTWWWRTKGSQTSEQKIIRKANLPSKKQVNLDGYDSQKRESQDGQTFQNQGVYHIKISLILGPRKVVWRTSQTIGRKVICHQDRGVKSEFQEKSHFYGKIAQCSWNKSQRKANGAWCKTKG